MIKIRQILFSCLLFCSINADAQPDTNVLFGGRDTVFVYDTLFIVDTIQILRTSKELENLEKLTPLEISYLHDSSSNKKILDFSNPQTATFFNLRINSLNNFNSKNKEMKKLGILGLMFFAFQNMILAQHNVGVHVGSGFHNSIGVYDNLLGDPDDNTLIRPSLQLGISYRKLVLREKLFLDIGLTFNKLRPSRIPAVQEYFDNGALSESGFFTIKETQVIFDEILVTKRNYNLVSLPITFSLNSKFFQPTIGVEFFHRDVYSVTEPIESGFEYSYISYPPRFVSIGSVVLLGFRLPITKRFNISVLYARQFVPNYSFRDLIVASSLGGKMQRLDITFRYQFLDMISNKKS